MRDALESVRCEVCGLDDARPLVVKRGWRLVRCNGCGLCYVSPRPRADALAQVQGPHEYFAGHVARAADERWLREARARLAFIARHHEPGALLDVGCATGWFLEVARDAGWQACGLDVSAEAVAHVRKLGFDARAQTLEACDFPAGSFDVITLFDSLEHMPHPVAALRAARRLLADDGLLVVTTPNIGGLFPQVTFRLFAQTIGAWEHPGPPAHIFQFSRETLAAALRKAGFVEEKTTTEAIPLAHTVGALEESIIEALQRTPPAAAPPPGEVAAPREAAQRERPRRGHPLKRALRAGVHSLCWGLAASVSLPAAWIGRGDSLVVLARKA